MQQGRHIGVYYLHHQARKPYIQFGVRGCPDPSCNLVSGHDDFFTGGDLAAQVQVSSTGSWSPSGTPHRARRRPQRRAGNGRLSPGGPTGKLMIWSWKLNDARRGGLTSRQFIRYGLLRLRPGDDLTHITTGKATRRAIALPEEVLALHPELRPIA